MIVEIKFQSDVGRKRKMNQDYAGVFENHKGIFLIVLADGMGGHQAGDIASKLAVNYLGEQWTSTRIKSQKASIQWLIENIQETNERIYQKGQTYEGYAGMGTTIVCTVFLADSIVVANVGDSRAYLVRDQKIKQLTEDHSLVNELVKCGEITPEMARHHPRKNVLTRSLGMPRVVKTDIFCFSICPDDYILLCSDGLTNMVHESIILDILLSQQLLGEKVDQLITSANEAGGTDNITAVVMHMDEPKEENQ